jgi:VanZ family protein
MSSKVEPELLAPNGLTAVASVSPLTSVPWQPSKNWVSIVRTATLVLLAYWTAIFVGTHLPAASIPNISLSDKLLHFVAYSGLAFLLAWAIPFRQGKAGIHAAVVLIVVTAYACIDEYSQQFVAGRTASLGDVAADVCGCVFGLTSYFCLRSLLLRSKLGLKVISILSR